MEGARIYGFGWSEKDVAWAFLSSGEAGRILGGRDVVQQRGCAIGSAQSGDCFYWGGFFFEKDLALISYFFNF